LLLVLGSEFGFVLWSFFFLDDGLELNGLGWGDEAGGKRNELWCGGLAGEPLVSGKSGLEASGVGVKIVLEDVGLSGHLEGDGFDGGCTELEELLDLARGNINTELGDGSHTTLRGGGLEFGKEVQERILIDNFVVTDVTVSLTGKVEDRGVVIVEWHDDTGGGIDVHGSNRLGEVTSLPDRILSFGGLGETSCEKLIFVSEPKDTHALDTSMSLNLSNNGVGAWVDASDLLVLSGGGDEGTVVVPGEGLDDVAVARNVDLGVSLLNIPNLDGEVGGRGGKNVVGDWGEVNGSDLSLVSGERLNGCVQVGSETALGDLPDLGITIF